MKRYDRKVALKLINKYADECNRVEEEKKSLQLEVNDLRANIIVNKEIIDKLFNNNLSIDEKSKELILSFKKEINILNNRIKQINKENSNLRIKVASYEKIINSDIEEYRESTNDLNDKIFILENENQKKENIIISLNKQISKMKEKEVIEIENEEDFNGEENEEESENNNYRNNLIPNEIYIIDPTASVNLIQDDLMLYKKAYENALNKIRETTSMIDKYENKINELKSQLYKYQNTNQINKNKNNDENDKINLQNNNNNEQLSKFNLNEIISIPDVDVNELEFICQSNHGVKILIILNKYIKQLNEKITKLKKQLSEIKDKLIKENNENMVLYKSILEMKAKHAIYQSFSHRNNSKSNLSENYINTDISLIGNFDDSNNKKHKKKINFTKNNDEKLNQSADDIMENFINHYFDESNKNYTEVNFNENQLFMNKMKNKMNKI